MCISLTRKIRLLLGLANWLKDWGSIPRKKRHTTTTTTTASTRLLE
jgi:hypothetical protein